LATFEQYDAVPGRPQLSTMAAVLRFNNLKVAASEKSAEIALAALGVIGILGYKNDTPFSVGRHVRDTLSAPLMVSNARIHATNASLLLIAKDV
jgi:acyl-CoA dehydrogenase